LDDNIGSITINLEDSKVDFYEAKKMITKIKKHRGELAEYDLALLISILAGRLEVYSPESYESFKNNWVRKLTNEV
jgi:hypothetical protein